MPRSIRRRLLLALLAATLGVWLASVTLAYRGALHEVDELLDAHLAQSAALLVAQSTELDEIDTEHLPLPHRYGRRVAFQVWEHGRELRVHSLNAPDARLSQSEEGFSDERIDGKPWRVFSAWSGELLIQVAEEGASRADIAASIGRNLALPLLPGLPLLGVLIAWIVGRGLRPLVALSGEVGQRAADRLEPLPFPQDTPAELQPLVTRLNALFAQLAGSFEAERRFTADAAHELRTPLSALRAQAQVAQGAAGDAERAAALAKVIQACDRASRLVEQLLTMARLEPAHLGQAATTVDLRAVAAAVVAEVAPQAAERDIGLSLEGGDSMIRGYPGLAAVLLRNLLDNAIRYSPPHTEVRIVLARAGDRATLEVIDQGPGIEAGKRERLGERFHRLGRSDTGGTGLGLSIVRRIAQLHGAPLEFTPGEAGGLRVALSFPDAGGVAAQP